MSTQERSTKGTSVHSHHLSPEETKIVVGVVCGGQSHWQIPLKVKYVGVFTKIAYILSSLTQKKDKHFFLEQRIMAPSLLNRGGFSLFLGNQSEVPWL